MNKKSDQLCDGCGAVITPENDAGGELCLDCLNGDTCDECGEWITPENDSGLGGLCMDCFEEE